MNNEIHDGSSSPMEIHISHELSDRDILRIRNDIEPFDCLRSKPANGLGNRPHGMMIQ
jgi:hypothetical protein